MLKKRLIPKFLLRDSRLVKYVRFFESERAAGSPVTTAKVYNDYGVDELIVLDIAPSAASRGRVIEIIERMSEEIFMPFTVGGGIRSVADAQAVLDAGADKVSVNSAALARPELIGELAEVFGAQCVVLAIDAKEDDDYEDGHRWQAFVAGGREPPGRDALRLALEGVERGAGEILLTSMDRDGTSDGYDLELTAADDDD